MASRYGRNHVVPVTYITKICFGFDIIFRCEDSTLLNGFSYLYSTSYMNKTRLADGGFGKYVHLKSAESGLMGTDSGNRVKT